MTPADLESAQRLGFDDVTSLLQARTGMVLDRGQHDSGGGGGAEEAWDGDHEPIEEVLQPP